MRTVVILGALFWAIVGAYVWWPSAHQINPDLPQPGLIIEPVRDESAIIIPVEVAFGDLATVIEQHFPDGEILHTGRKQESKSLSYRYTVRRWGNSSFDIKDGALEVSLPLRVDATGRKDICIGIKRRDKCKGIKTHETGDATAFVDAKALIALIVTEDYQIEVGTNVTQELTNSPYIDMDILGDAIRVKINIEEEVEKLLVKQEGKVAGKLDVLLARQIENIDLKSTLNKHWQTVRSPIQLGDAWVSLDPKTILFKGIHQISDDKVALGFGFSGPTVLSLTEPSTPPATPLPPIASAFAPAEFNLQVPLTSAFEDLNLQATKALTGKTITKDGYWLTVEAIEISGTRLENAEQEDRATLLAAVDFKAGRGETASSDIEAEGTLHLTFMPSIDTEERVLHIVDAAVTSETLNLIEAAGVSWLNSKFTPELLAKVRYDYGKEIDKWQPRLNQQLANGISYQGFVVGGILDEVNLGGFYVSGSQLEVYLTARGKVSAALKALPL